MERGFIYEPIVGYRWVKIGDGDDDMIAVPPPEHSYGRSVNLKLVNNQDDDETVAYWTGAVCHLHEEDYLC